MAKTRTKSTKKNGGIVKLKVVVERLQKSLLSGMKLFSDNEDDECDEVRVPEDVKEGHFVVMAEDDDELKRFIVPLSFLNLPSFLRLLEEAAEEYGFDRDGALMVPCRPDELERILAREEERDSSGSRGGGHKWRSCNETTVVKRAISRSSFLN